MSQWMKGLKVVAALAMGAALTASARAEDCPRGQLDKAYCDRNGDLVADDLYVFDLWKCREQFDSLFAFFKDLDPHFAVQSEPRLDLLHRTGGGPFRGALPIFGH